MNVSDIAYLFRNAMFRLYLVAVKSKQTAFFFSKNKNDPPGHLPLPALVTFCYHRNEARSNQQNCLIWAFTHEETETKTGKFTSVRLLF